MLNRKTPYLFVSSVINIQRITKYTKIDHLNFLLIPVFLRRRGKRNDVQGMCMKELVQF